jgi:hypothetical protein
MLALILACAPTPTCDSGEKFSRDGLCVLDTGLGYEVTGGGDADADADADADSDTDTATTEGGAVVVGRGLVEWVVSIVRPSAAGHAGAVAP